MSNIFKDIGAIWSRLFDHRPFLHGEEKFFIREFQDKRSDREVEQLFTIFEKATEIKDTELNRFKIAANNHLPSMQINLPEGLDLAIDVLNIEKKFAKDTTLTGNRIKRQIEWNEFKKDLEFKFNRVDNTFEEKEDEIQEFYTDLERKLSLTK